MNDALCVIASLYKPLAGEPPQLDSLLIKSWFDQNGDWEDHSGIRCSVSGDAVDTSNVPIPIERIAVETTSQSGEVETILIPRSSSGFLNETQSEYVDYYAKRLSIEHCQSLAPSERKAIMTNAGWTKSYRLPLRVRVVDHVVWFCVGDADGVFDLIKDVQSIGKKRAYGYGLVAEWTVKKIEPPSHDRWPWWDNVNNVPRLLRPLPQDLETVAGLTGWKPDFGACTDPYWHPDRYREIVVPC